MAVQKIVVAQGQSLMDVAIQHGGDATALYDLAFANGIGITDDVPAATMLLPPPVVNAGVVAYLKGRNIIPATANELPESQQKEGLEFWAIEYDFVIN